MMGCPSFLIRLFSSVLTGLFSMGLAMAQQGLTQPLGLSTVVHAALPIKLVHTDLTATVLDNSGHIVKTVDLGPQTLPWRWDPVFTRQRGVMHFRFDVHLDDELVTQLQMADMGLGFSAKNMGNRYRLRVNGGDWTEMGWEEPTTQMRQKPRWHLLAAKDFRSGANRIDVEIKAEPANDAGLTDVELASSDISLKAHISHLTALYTSAAVVGALAFVVCALAMVMAILTREKFFLVIGIGELMYVLHQVEWLLEYPPVPTWMFNTFRILVFVWYTGTMCWFSLILVNRPAPWLARFIKAYMWAALPVIGLGMYLGDYRVYPLTWPAIMAVMVIITAVRLSYYAWKDADPIVCAYTLGGWVALIFALYEYAMELLPTGFGYLRLGSYSLAVLSLALCVVIVQRYLITRRALDQLKVSRNHQAETAALRERQRMTQDIHDSVGSQLVALLSLINSSAPQKQIKAHTEEALNELRLAIDAVSTEDGDLSLVLASLRHRLQPRLEAARLHLVWKVDSLPQSAKMSHQDILHVQRIVLEVVSNTIQHAQAKQIVFSAHYDSHASLYRISIADDGKGFDPTCKTGNGIAIIHKRADLLGASILITRNDPTGVTVNIRLPRR